MDKEFIDVFLFIVFYFFQVSLSFWYAVITQPSLQLYWFIQLYSHMTSELGCNLGLSAYELSWYGHPANMGGAIGQNVLRGFLASEHIFFVYWQQFFVWHNLVPLCSNYFISPTQVLLGLAQLFQLLETYIIQRLAIAPTLEIYGSNPDAIDNFNTLLVEMASVRETIYMSLETGNILEDPLGLFQKCYNILSSPFTKSFDIINV